MTTSPSREHSRASWPVAGKTRVSVETSPQPRTQSDAIFTSLVSTYPSHVHTHTDHRRRSGSASEGCAHSHRLKYIYGCRKHPQVMAAESIPIHFIDGETEAPVGLNSETLVTVCDESLEAGS